jgi:glycosyltransferase involved in cell wall biosynthesis
LYDIILPMKILVATPLYPPDIGGPATYTVELAERLHGEHELTVVAYADVPQPLEGARLIAVSKQQPLPVRLIKYGLALWKASKNVEVIYAQNALAAGLPAMLVGRMRRLPVVIKFVGDEAWERASALHQTKKRLEEFLRHPEGSFRVKLMMAIQGYVLRHVSRVSTPSAYLSQELIRAYRVKRENAVVNYNAAEETETPPFSPQKMPHQIATTARLVTWKGIDGIIRATTLVRKNFPDATLKVAGDGPEMENLQKLVKELHAENYVTLMGRISRAETWQLRKNSSVYVLNSTYEGLPHTVLTSFAAEIPTVATDIPGTNEAIYNEDTGLLVEPGDDEALAKAIERFFNDPALCDRVVTNGTKLLHKKFSWEAHLKSLIDLFESLAHKPRN